MNWNDLNEGFIPSFWKKNLTFENKDLSPFARYENVITVGEIATAVSRGAVGLNLPLSEQAFVGIIWDYGQGKLVNKVDTKAWVRNYCSEISLWILSNARYLQAYERDINKNYNQKDIDFTDTQGNNTQISTTAGTQSNGSHSINDTANAGHNESAGEQLGDTLTVLNNQTTSTKTLATSNEDNYSKGDLSVGKSSESAASNDVNASYSENRGAGQVEGRNNGRSHSYGTLSPLSAMNLEKNFPFQNLLTNLFDTLDKYFTVSGYEYD